MNDLLAVAEQVRKHYLNALLASFKEYKKSRQPSSLEVMFELQRETPLPFRLYRADMASNTNGEPGVQEVNTITHLSFEPFSVEFNFGLSVEVHPMHWNDVEVHANAQIEAAAFEEWALKWLDLEDEHATDMEGLQGVIHAITIQESEVGSSRVALDWGSAPMAAMEELLQLLHAKGATTARLSTPGLER
jgi:hypothetical protein